MNTIIRCLIVSFWVLSLGLYAGPGLGAERVTYYHLDLQGSPVATTDRNGEVVWREQYKPYGQRMLKQDGGTNKLWYTGKAHEEGTGLSYYGARWYHPQLGRFMAIDPVDFQEDNVQSFNRYAYANNNPYRFVDPDGQSPKDVWLQKNGLNFLKLDAGYGPGIGATGGSGVRGTSASRGARTDAQFSSAVEREIAKREGAVIGRVKDLQNLKQGEKSLLDRLPDQGSPKANWKQNSGVLRQEMGKGQPIRDASPGDTAGQFLNAERNLLKDRSWTFDPKTNYWNPPAQ